MTDGMNAVFMLLVFLDKTGLITYLVLNSDLYFLLFLLPRVLSGGQLSGLRPVVSSSDCGKVSVISEQPPLLYFLHPSWTKQLNIYISCLVQKCTLTTFSCFDWTSLQFLSFCFFCFIILQCWCFFVALNKKITADQDRLSAHCT